MLDISKILGDHVPTGSGTSEKITPLNIINDMLDILPDEVWNKQSKFLDIACKSGNFLREIYKRLLNHPRMIEEFPDDSYRKEYILHNQLYGITFNRLEQALASRNVYGYVCNENIVCIENWESIVKNKDNRFLINKLKETFKDMNFNVVVGNPPYNNDIYLDFVTLGHNISTNYTLMITPAKWQAKSDNKNNIFRQNVVPCMSDIVFYPDTEELFDIREVSGISYYVIKDKSCKEKNIQIRCNKNKIIDCNYEKHDESTVILANRKILSIIGKVGTLGEGFKQSLYVKNTDHGEETIAGTLGFKRCTFTGEQERGEQTKQADYVEVMQGEKVCGYKKVKELFTTEKLDKWKITTSIMAGNIYLDDNGKTLGIVPCNILKPYQVPKGSYPVLRYFDTEEECKSFKSYYESKLVSFLFYFGACGTTLTKEFYRFIPDPVNFDHIFTDEELYKKYELTDEEIKIIESVIKERK